MSDVCGECGAPLDSEVRKFMIHEPTLRGQLVCQVCFELVGAICTRPYFLGLHHEWLDKQSKIRELRRGE